MVPLSAGASTDEGENGAGSGAGSGSAGRIPLSGRALLDALERQAPAEVPDRGAFICGFRSECGRTLWEPLVLTCGHAVCRGQGLTLVHFSAQLEPCLTHRNTLHTLNTP